MEDEVLKLAQKCLSEVPVIVLGSGASLQYGVGGMDELGEHLAKNIAPTEAADLTAWQKFIDDLKVNHDLEGALTRVALSASLEARVVNETREMVLPGDQGVFAKMIAGELALPLSELLRHLLNTTYKSVSIITTNYDRLAEYAADAAGFAHHEGFSHGYLRTFSPESRNAVHKTGVKWVDILKVHGSLDWFLDTQQNPIALPDATPVPTGFTPVMVTPGVGKYQVTHDEPFRSIITQADRAFASARAIICIGYGFRDRHIQPKLQSQIAKQRVPVVFLAKVLSQEIKDFIKTCQNSPYLALEQAGADTRAYVSGHPNGIDVPGSIWEMSTFIKFAI